MASRTRGGSGGPTHREIYLSPHLGVIPGPNFPRGIVNNYPNQIVLHGIINQYDRGAFAFWRVHGNGGIQLEHWISLVESAAAWYSSLTPKPPRMMVGLIRSVWVVLSGGLVGSNRSRA